MQVAVNDQATTVAQPRKGEAQIEDAVRNFDSLPDGAFVRDAVVAKLRGVTRNTVWRWAKSGVLPPAEKVGGSSRWRVGTLRQAFGLAASKA